MITEAEFVARFGGIYEHSQWVADEVAAEAHAIEDLAEIAALMAECVDNAAEDRQLALIRAHPDLAGKAQIAGDLTAESTDEQASAGLDQCTAEEYAQFRELNDRYKDKFGFPFVMAVRESSRADILAAFAARLSNDATTEFETALQEIHKIAQLRLQAMDVET